MSDVNISLSNQRLQDIITNRRLQSRLKPELLYPWWWAPCKVKTLLVTDGFLWFDDTDFGLSAFIDILQNNNRNYVSFELTLAHRENVPDSRMGNAADIERRIKSFRFDNPDHFNADMYDQIWLFGASRSLLSNSEISAIYSFMNNGGGVFATGDHGDLGFGLCSKIPRVRSMRIWGNPGDDMLEVSMRGTRRNDTNQVGDPGTQFDDQSDDIPQKIYPKLYLNKLSALFEERYPHPLLCSRFGIINVMPDHAHEGECKLPDDPTLTYEGEDEYPTVNGTRLLPEFIAFSSVPAGNDSGGSKSPTDAHSFPSICAYDGHLANVGRVVTDATWHHFVNINLIGDIGNPDPIKKSGFLASNQGVEALEKIKEYYINIGVWMSPESKIECFNRRLIWTAFNQHRIVESSMLSMDLSIERVRVETLFTIGTHAMDVIGKSATPCRRLKFLLELVRPLIPNLVPNIDPWNPQFVFRKREGMPWVDLNPLLKIGLGAGILAIRDEADSLQQMKSDELEEKLSTVFLKGVEFGFSKASKFMVSDLKKWATLLEKECG